MPDKRRHRGPDPEDPRLFAPAPRDVMRQAVSDLSWLLSRGYALPSANDLVGNRFSLVRRQRIAVARCSCSDDAREGRRSRHVPTTAPLGEVWLDGYNVLNALEAALSGGGHYRRTGRVLPRLGGHPRPVSSGGRNTPSPPDPGECLTALGATPCRWLLDRPVSNSGRLQGVLTEIARRAGWDWSVELVYNPDRALIDCGQCVATSDSAILDRCARWVNLARVAIDRHVPRPGSSNSETPRLAFWRVGMRGTQVRFLGG